MYHDGRRQATSSSRMESTFWLLAWHQVIIAPFYRWNRILTWSEQLARIIAIEIFYLWFQHYKERRKAWNGVESGNGLLENDSIDFLKKAFRSLTERPDSALSEEQWEDRHVFFKISVDLGKLVGLNVAGLHLGKTLLWSVLANYIIKKMEETFNPFFGWSV